MHKIGTNITKIAQKMVSPDLGVQSGFTDLDAYTLGLHPSDYAIVAGRPSMGKTSFLLQLALQVGKPVLIISAEMPEQSIGERFISQLSGLGMHKIKGKRTSAADKDKARQAVEQLRDMDLYIEDKSPVTPLSIRKAISGFKLETGSVPACVFIDYLQLLSVPDVFGSGERELTLISRELKAIAKSFDIPIVVACQLNRETERRENHAPKMSDLRGSGSIEQDADLVLMLHRPAYYRITEDDIDSSDDGESYIYISKNRNGPVGKLEYRWNKYTMSFSEVSSRYKEFGA